MREYEVINLKNEIVNIIYGYSKADALRRYPEYASNEFILAGGWYVD